MGITIRLELSADCEHCSANLMLDDLDVAGRPTRKKLMQLFNKSGWKTVNGRLLCPECIQTNCEQPNCR